MSWECGQKIILAVFFFYDFNMILICFEYDFHMLKNMVFYG